MDLLTPTRDPALTPRLVQARWPVLAAHLRSRYGWKMLWASLRFAGAGGRTPVLGRGLESVSFAAIEGPWGPLSPAAEALLTRFFRVKIQSLHFCGRAFHDRPLIEGFRSLALLFPVILWLGRWLAVSDQRTTLSDADLAQAISMVDHRHGHAPYLRWRVQLLSQRDDIARLCAAPAPPRWPA